MQFSLPQAFGMQKQWPDEECGTLSIVIAADSLSMLLRKAVVHGMFTLNHLKESIPTEEQIEEERDHDLD